MAVDPMVETKRKRGMAVCDMSKNVQAKRIKRGGRHIPLDIMNEILLRLPARSLLRFRRACKLWCSITHDPYFIDAHLRLQRASRIPTILFFPNRDNTNGAVGITHLDGGGGGGNSSSAPKPYFLRPKPRDQWTDLRGSCNGILCITGNHGNIQLLNPLTGESLTPPEPTPCRNMPVVHFGFNPLTKEYKVLRFFVRSPFQQFRGTRECEVYTLGTRSWRPVRPTLERPPFTRGVTAKGTMYWKTFNADSIPCFDLSDERFTSISLPNFGDVYRGEKYLVATHLGDLQGSICLPVFRDTRLEGGSYAILTKMDVWVLVASGGGGGGNHTGSTHEWARKYSLRFPNSLSPSKPLLMHNEKTLVFKSDRHRTSKQEWGVPVLECHQPLEGGDKACDEEQVGGSIGTVDDAMLGGYKKGFEHWVHVESLVSLPKP